MRTSYELADWQGYLTHPEIDAIKEIARNLPPKAVIVKIGAGAGTDTLAILEENQDVLIFSIDILAGEYPITTNEHLRLAETEFANTGHVIRIWGDSKIVGLRFPVTIDWLHIDGDHSKAGIEGDIKAWLGNVRPRGIVSFHDYDEPKWTDIKPVVDYYMKNYQRLILVDKFIAFRIGQWKKPDES